MIFINNKTNKFSMSSAIEQEFNSQLREICIYEKVINVFNTRQEKGKLPQIHLNSEAK